MRKKFLVIICLCISVLTYSQTTTAIKNYESGTEALQSEKFQEAIILLNKSIDEFPTADAYFNRAIAHSNLFDSCNYCNDLGHASNLGDKEAEKMHNEKCIIRDTIHEVADSIFEEFPGYAYTISMRTICSDHKNLSYRNSEGKYIESAWIKMPTFPGGEVKRNKFLAENIIYPNEAAQKGYQGTVYVSFVIESDGSVADIKLLLGPGGGLNEEALRVINLMPKWKPGTRKGKPIRVVFNMPIYFKLG